MKAGNLLDRLEDRPFKPFRIHMSDGSQLNVTDAGLLLVGEDSAIMPTAFTKDDRS